MKPLNPWTLSLVLLSAFAAAGAEPFVQNSDDRLRIEQAIPAQAPARPAKPRNLLIFTLNVGYGGHGSISYANEAFRLMGRKTGAFETTVSDDPAVFQAESLRRFDAVFFNNTVGDCFTNASLRRNLLEFVTGGGGLLGVHGTSVAFTRWPGAIEDWPEFGCLIGGRGANHKDSDEHVWIRLEDPQHPLCQAFGGAGFDFRDEFFRVHEPYSRQRVRVLLGIDTDKTDVRAGQPRGDCLRADNDYALAWIRNYGRGRVFYCTIAHNPYVFWDAKMLRFYLSAVQFALGDLPAPTTPSAWLTPAVRAQERLGWRLALTAAQPMPLFAAIDRAAQLRLPYLGALGSQAISPDQPAGFACQLPDDQLQAVRLKLDAAGVRLLTWQTPDLPEEEGALRSVFEFCRKLGIETIISAPQAQNLDRIEKYCEDYGIDLALRGAKALPADWQPSAARKICAPHGRRIGVCADLGAWLKAGIDPVKAVKILKERLLVVRLADVDARGPKGRPVSWGSGAGQVAKVLAELQRLGLRPTFLADEPPVASGARADLATSVDFFNSTCLQLAQ